MTDFAEVAGLLHVYEKCIGHGESLKAIKDAAWMRLLEINSDMMEPATPHVPPQAQVEPPVLKAEPQPEPVVEPEPAPEPTPEPAVEPVHDETPGQPTEEPAQPTVLERKL